MATAFLMCAIAGSWESHCLTLDPSPAKPLVATWTLKVPGLWWGAKDSDAVYVFRKEGNNWVFESELISEDQDGDGQPDIQGFFLGWGQTVRIAGDSIAVGARLYNIPGTPPLFELDDDIDFDLDLGEFEGERDP